MAALTTLVVAGGLALGAASVVAQTSAQKKAEKRAAAEAAQAKVEATEAGKLRAPEQSDPKIRIGTEDPSKSTKRKRSSDRPVRKSNNTPGGISTSASRIGGL